MYVWHENNYIMNIENGSKFLSYIKPLKRTVASQKAKGHVNL